MNESPGAVNAAGVSSLTWRFDSAAQMLVCENENLQLIRNLYVFPHQPICHGRVKIAYQPTERVNAQDAKRRRNAVDHTLTCKKELDSILTKYIKDGMEQKQG